MHHCIGLLHAVYSISKSRAQRCGRTPGLVLIWLLPLSYYSLYIWDGRGCLLLMIVQMQHWMNSLGPHTYGSSHVEQSRIACKSLGNLPAPAHIPPPSTNIQVLLEKPLLFFPSLHCPIPAQFSPSLPQEQEVSSRAGTEVWQFGQRWRLPRSLSTSVCVPPSLLHERTPP